MSSSPKLRDSFEEHMCNSKRSEVKILCSFKSPSCVRTPTKETLLAFPWSKSAEEIRGKAPLLQKVLETVLTPKLNNDTTRFPGLCLKAGTLLKLRDPAMRLVPYVMSLMLKAGGLSKKVSGLNPQLILGKQTTGTS